MKITTYSVNGTESYGVVTDDGIIDAKPLAGGPQTLRGAIAAGALDIIAEAAAGKSPDHSLDEIEFLPVIPDPDKIMAVGLNYRSHVLEGGRDIPEWPMIFTRFSNSQVGHGQAMIKPKASDMFDFEGEMAVIIGKTCRHVSEADALSVVAGYSCYNDGSIRDYQRHTSQFVPGKSFYKSGAFGPWMVTADEFNGYGDMHIEARVNGEVRQTDTTANLMFDFAYLISYVSTIMTLKRGDIISTGTPIGAGARFDPPIWLKPGDVLEVEASGIGVLRNEIVDEAV